MCVYIQPVTGYNFSTGVARNLILSTRITISKLRLSTEVKASRSSNVNFLDYLLSISVGRQWTYQTCTEFGYYQSSDLQNQPFGHNFPLK